MTKTVGVLTFHDAYNFGAVLQVFALQRTIVSYGYSCSIINYRRPGVYPLLSYPKSINDIKSDILKIFNMQSHLKLRKRFSDFLTSYLTCTTRIYRSLDDFFRVNPIFDIYVTGSDQVWNPYLLDRQGGMGSIYYLDFVSSGRRVAYAPSFGLSEIPEAYKDRISGFLRRFDFLSSREDTGCINIHELTGMNATHVLDPTLLQDSSEYDKVAVDPSFSRPYILMYPMQSSEPLKRLVLTVRKNLGLPIVAVLPSHFNPGKFTFADKVVFDAGPAEFLGWMKDASFVCTNSFHGTCFAIIYRKTFLGVQPSIGNTRIQSLLECMGLSSRQVLNPERLASKDALFEPIDYFFVEKPLDQAIKKSLDYLKIALA